MSWLVAADAKSGSTPRWQSGARTRSNVCLPNAQDPHRRRARREPRSRRKPGEASPIKYVIYIIKENRTYDQVFGDMKEGNGDPSLCLFDEAITPNHHALAREFVLLDNFYVEAEVSADGHEWTMGAYATDFVEKTWPLSYGHDKGKKLPYPAEGNLALSTPAGGYFWDRAKEAGVSYRSYGEWVAQRQDAGGPRRAAKAKALEGHFDPMFRSYDLDYPDVKRAERFISELQRFEKEGEMPRLQIVRLPNDHTSGTEPRQADAARACRRQRPRLRAWSSRRFRTRSSGRRRRSSSIEDDAQNGPDHVDAHRTIAFAISPYMRRGTRGQHAVLHLIDAAHDGTDPRAEADEPVRRRGPADVRELSEGARPDALRLPARSRWT